MPELPDVELYLHALRPRVVHQPLGSVRLFTPFVLRSVTPSLGAFQGEVVRGVSRLGKRIVMEFPEERYLVIHLMVAGRLRWDEKRGAKKPGKIGLAAFDFPSGTLLFTEASGKKRASLIAVQGRNALAALDPGGIDVLTIDLREFAAVLSAHNHTLKRALTDPHLFSGIGNAYSDEILHAARLSPVQLTSKLDDERVERLYTAVQRVLREWTARLQEEFGSRFPGVGDVTAFRPEFATHGKFGKPCPVCASPVQRIKYAENETNYCAVCQTGGKLLADRSLSRLLKQDWPRSLDEMELHIASRRHG